MNIDHESQLACTCDMLNTWARESGVAECKNPYDGLAMRDLVDRLWSRTSGRIADLRERVQKKEEFADHAAHVIVEAGIVPGVDYSCRCEACRAIAKSMNDAGYLERIKDRWWDDAVCTTDVGDGSTIYDDRPREGAQAE